MFRLEQKVYKCIVVYKFLTALKCMHFFPGVNILHQKHILALFDKFRMFYLFGTEKTPGWTILDKKNKSYSENGNILKVKILQVSASKFL